MRLTAIFANTVRVASLALLLHAGSALAAPVMELRVEDLLPMAPHLRNALALNPNQLLLWQQSEARTRTLLRERQARRERLQKGATQLAAREDAELRELGLAAETEAAASAQEEAQLRSLWLTMNDALDDNQRRTVLRFLADQLERVRDGAPPAHAEGKASSGAGREGGHGAPGGGRGRPGNGGAGAGASAGGGIGF
ncbi:MULTISPECIES: hypothetical protein [unclassified Massilia]|uniref:hypothetical protein n=1 Tax=unclassified Massilia TaxID=2609279 RepID=UPI001786973D|nr:MULTISPECIES: hypothetical protein [unclassified Massilia]MBD8531372.1 hypothetical protein [Massilia sp. CFBP 13647]MBD8674374.1 hypothetical protein [Massilia sp. CFBP 13721]